MEAEDLVARPARPGHVHPGHAEPDRPPRADRTAPVPIGLADRCGRSRAGSRRCSPPRCRIPMSAVAGYAPAAARRAAKRRASHEHRRGKRYGGTAHRADRRTRGRAERVIKGALLRDDRAAAPPPRGPAVLALPAHQWRVAAHGRRAPAHGDRVVYASPRGVTRPASPTRGRRQVPDA